MQAELINRGFNEIVDVHGNLVFFDDDHQFMKKIFSYDDDVAEIVDELFSGMTLNDPTFDQHFKKGFLYRFINRRINRQTVEAFRLELLSTFLSSESYINRIYADVDKYLEQTTITDQTNKQTNKQKNEGSTLTDNRSAFADLPQNNVQIDVDSTIMESASDNTISRNKQRNTQDTEGETAGESFGENKSYKLDELFKTNGLLENIYNKFDRKCFLQVW
jgi:hypothetical protein